jgi:low-affinity ferrous iron transport protein
MKQISKAIRAPGARRATERAAPTQLVINVDSDESTAAATSSTDNINAYIILNKTRRLDRWLDKVVEFSGSEWIFFTIIVALLAWAFLGIPFAQANDWQIAISDAQAVLNMIFDAFLMRQQLNSYDSLMFVSASLRSRTSSNKRMLASLIGSRHCEQALTTHFQDLQQTEFVCKLPAENWLGRISTAVSSYLGHIATVFGFWVCVLVWIGFGQYRHWSTTWQLFMNSASSAWMVFILAFLANIRERHNNYTTKCLQYIYEVDTALELRLRTATGDRIKNETVVIPSPSRSGLQRVIDYYADLVGTLLGIAILFFVIIVWVVIGPALSFDSNWWLLIGTYAGLVGMNDGFVLRNVQHTLGCYENAEFARLMSDDKNMLAVAGVPQLDEEKIADDSLNYRISVMVGNLCSHEITVVLGVVLILGLIVGASAMRWSVTGQLLCNVPPSIIESFFMMILITGHNIGDAKKRVDLHNIYLRRLKLISFVNTMVKLEKQ